MPNPFDAKAKKSLSVNGKEYTYYSLPALGDARLSTSHTFTLWLFSAYQARFKCVEVDDEIVQAVSHSGWAFLA